MRIIFVGSIKLKPMNKQKEKKQVEQESDLIFYLNYYKELSTRSPRLKKELDYEINRLVEALKKKE